MVASTLHRYAQGKTAAGYAYDAFGLLTSASKSFGSGTTWTNPLSL